MELNIRKVTTDWQEMPSGLTYMIIGQPKTGKTTAASAWSEKGQAGVLLIDTDLGSDFVDGANTVTCSSLNAPTREKTIDGKVVKEGGQAVLEVVPPKERGHFVRSGPDKGQPLETYSLIEVYLYLKENWDSLPYDTVVIDTLGQVNRWIEDVVTQELGINEMGEGQWGADWGKARKKHLDVVKRFQELIKQKGGNLVLVVHSKTSTLTDGKVQLMPELPRGLAYGLTASADVVGYTTGSRDDEKFYISFLSYDERAVGSRLKPLAQKTLPFNYESIMKEVIGFKTKEE
jgi:hypothetical protein